jgi:beta-phosphoglucomutase-like phosphatase (HAD superfamily)
MTGYDEERMAQLLRLLRPAPEGWVRAAQELPKARAELAAIVARAEADAAFRAQVLADLEAALESEGIDPIPSVVAALRVRLDAD